MEARLRLTSHCNLNCEYCFAKEFRGRNSGDISLSDLKMVINKLKESDITTLKIQGGEPTCHKGFKEVSQNLRDAGFILHLYTNGIFDNSITKIICRNYRSVIINCNQLTGVELETLTKNIDDLLKLGCSVMLGKTISSQTSDVDGFLKFAKKFKEKIKIRFDASRPHTYREESFETFKEDAHRVIDALLKAKIQGFELEVDCCYPPCIFSKSEWKLIRKYLRGFWSKCTTIIDISPDLMITTCFCGAQFTDLNIDDFISLREASLFAEYIENKMRFDIPSQSMCITCQKRLSKMCQGGCLGHKKTALRYSGKKYLEEFRTYFNDLCKSDYKNIISSDFSPMSKCFLLREKEIGFRDLEQFYEREISQEPDNPFLYAYLASSVYFTGNYMLVNKILQDMPTTDPEANFIKEKILSKIGENNNE